MKFFTSDLGEWKNLQKEFNQTRVARNILGLNRIFEFFDLLIFILAFFTDQFSTYYDFIVLIMLLFIQEILLRIAYYKFLNIYCDSKK